MRAKYSQMADFSHMHIINDCIEYIIKPIVHKVYPGEFIAIIFTYGPDQSSTIQIRIVGEFYFYISGFPGNCGWLVVHGLNRYHPNRKLVLDISTAIAKYMRFAGIFVSHHKGIYNNKYLGPWKEFGGRTVAQGYNLHSGNNIECVYVPIEYDEDAHYDDEYDDDEEYD